MKKKDLIPYLGLLSLIVIFFLGFLEENYWRICNFESEHASTVAYCELLSLSLLPLLLFIPFGIFFFFVRDEVFMAWWRFTRWFIPSMMAIIFMLYWGGESGGAGITGIGRGAFQFVVAWLLCIIFILTSLIKIFLAYRQVKKS